MDLEQDDSNTLDRTLSVRRPTNPQYVDKRAVQERRQSTTRILAVSIVVIAILYIARQVFIPIALAILFAFLLTPIVSLLERSFLRRTGAVVIALGLAVTIIGTGGWWIYQQVNALAGEISVATTSKNIDHKLRFFHRSSTGTFAVVERTLQRVADSTDTVQHPDMKVQVIPEKRNIGDRYRSMAPTVEFVASGFLVVVLVFFLLQDREQLRDKMLRLAGRAHLTVTTQAIGETSQRISRYLLTISLINIGFGLLIAVGLVVIGVPHAALWGVISGLLRFIPYVGAVLSASMPTFLAFALFPSWYTSIAVLALYILTDQLLGGFIEPLVVGGRIGVSPIALLISAIFWGWMWGPVGLLLAVPISVCLTVGGEFIPALRVFSIMFGTEDPLEGYLSFYNRLLVRDRSGAIALADRHAEDETMEEVFNHLFIPTLTFAAEELERKRITTANDHFIKDVTRELIVRLGDRNGTTSDPPNHIVAVSVAGERLSLGTLMLTQLLRAEGFSVDYFTDLPDEDLVAFLREVTPEALFISCSNVKHSEQGYALLSLLADRCPDLMIVAGGSGFAADRDRTLASGATYVPSTLMEAKEDFLQRGKRTRRKTSLAMTFSGTRSF